jgi:hypothetical protein
MKKLIVYENGSFFIFGTSQEPNKQDKYICIIPRHHVFVDRITIPKIALKEGGVETLKYQAKKIFEIKESEVAYRIVREHNETVELLLFAVERELIKKIFEKARSQDLQIAGATLASVALAKEKGCLWIQWREGVEVAVYEKGLKDVFFVYPDEKEQLRILEKECGEKVVIDPYNWEETSSSDDAVLFTNPYFKERKVNVLSLILLTGILIVLVLGAYWFKLKNTHEMLQVELQALEKKSGIPQVTAEKS